MVFSSHVFVFYFLPLTLGIYFLLPARLRNPWLLVASYVFYGWWNPWFVTLMLGSSVVDFVAGALIGAPGRPPAARRAILAAAVSVNLSLLGFFKYWGFFARSVAAVAPGVDLPLWDVVLPVGISFYTFQSMSYTIDVYRGDVAPARSFLDFAAYVALFPQLVAGPIVRYRSIADELVSREHSLGKVTEGISWFALGMAKKLILADAVAPVADAAFAADAPPWHLAWLGVTAYAFQIYFDFSGYSDMAVGLGRMLGFTFPRNFDMPYRSESITEFWRRWHISLSTWLRDYLYVPLGGSRRGERRTYLNLLVTMLLGGLWHGAAWNFVVWGGIHGLLLALERALGRRAPYAFLPRPLRVALTFVLVLVTWVFFRAESLGSAIGYLGCMAGLGATTPASSLLAAEVLAPFPVFAMMASALAVWAAPRQWHLPAARPSWRWAMATACLFLASLLEMELQAHRPFLYFQF